jgi:hypothetical protein
MAQFIAFAPGIQVNGETVLSIVEGMGTFKDKAVKILSDNGIKNPTPGAWYPQQSWLNAFKTIAESVGASTLYMIGKKIPENAKFPPAIDNLEKALGSIDVAYHMNHTTGNIGTYKLAEYKEKAARMVCENPYPCEFDRGIIETMCQRFKPKGSIIVQVKHDDAKPCRKKGASSCSYLVSW